MLNIKKKQDAKITTHLERVTGKLTVLISSELFFSKTSAPSLPHLKILNSPCLDLLIFVLGLNQECMKLYTKLLFLQILHEFPLRSGTTEIKTENEEFKIGSGWYWRQKAQGKCLMYQFQAHNCFNQMHKSNCFHSCIVSSFFAGPQKDFASYALNWG